MAQAADYVLQRLSEWGVQRVYGYPGDGLNGLLGTFDRADGDPEPVQARHEEMAAFMARAHATFTGEAGCRVATSGPGAVGIAARGVRRKLTEYTEYTERLPGRH